MNDLICWFQQTFPELKAEIFGIGRTAILTVSNGSFDGLTVGLNTPLKRRPNYYATTCISVAEAQRTIVLYMASKE